MQQRTRKEKLRRIAGPWTSHSAQCASRRKRASQRIGPPIKSPPQKKSSAKQHEILPGRAQPTAIAVQRSAVNPWFTWDPRHGSSRVRMDPCWFLSVQRRHRLITHVAEGTSNIYCKLQGFKPRRNLPWPSHARSTRNSTVSPSSRVASDHVPVPRFSTLTASARRSSSQRAMPSR